MSSSKKFKLIAMLCLLWSACDAQNSQVKQIDSAPTGAKDDKDDGDGDGDDNDNEPTDNPEPEKDEKTKDFEACITAVFFNSKPQTVGDTTIVNRLSGQPSFIAAEEYEGDENAMDLYKESAENGQRLVLISKPAAGFGAFDKTLFATAIGLNAKLGVEAGKLGGFDNFASIVTSHEACKCMQKHGVSIGSKSGNFVVGLGKFASQEQSSWTPESEFARNSNEQVILVTRWPDDVEYEDIMSSGVGQDPTTFTFDQCRVSYTISNLSGNAGEFFLIGVGENNDQIETHIPPAE